MPAVHHLREAINTLQPTGVIPMDLLAKYDAPILASTLKLWLLELNPPLCIWDSWDDIKKIYPHGNVLHTGYIPMFILFDSWW